MESTDSLAYNGSEIEQYIFPEATEAQFEGRQAAYDHNNVQPNWNYSSQLPPWYEHHSSSAYTDRFVKRNIPASSASEDILTRKNSSHQISPCGSYQASSNTASDQLSVADKVTNFKQITLQNQQTNVQNNAQYTIHSNISRSSTPFPPVTTSLIETLQNQQTNVQNNAQYTIHSNISRSSTPFSPVTTSLIEQASMQQLYNSVDNKNINYKKPTERRPNKYRIKTKNECTVSNSVLIAATYAWIQKSKNEYVVDKGKNNNRRRIRQSYTRHQQLECEKQFHTSQYISKQVVKELALRTDLSERQVKVWFQNRRMKQKRETKNYQQRKYQEMQTSSLLHNGSWQTAQNLSSSNSESSSIFDTSIESNESINNVFYMQSQQPNHVQTQLHPTVSIQSSQFMPSQVQTTFNMQQITNEHNPRLYVQQQQYVHSQPQNVLYTQSQPVVHTQSSFMQLQMPTYRRQPITQQLQQPSTHVLSQLQMPTYRSSHPMMHMLPQAMNVQIPQ
ncbi:homeobox protein Hox-A2 [Ooceraea biroi]|uniref:homeobox protein Hox-A2 n=1 Tax=Ooceraea biroi TaxID=2015173 RepID=UPI000F08E3E1|nr:homeobox protein Hox-A2 [Ooceraea biroi]